MWIDKATVVEHLRAAGEHDRAAQADRELPERVDVDHHASLLQGLGVDPAQLDGGGGGVNGMLGA